MPRAPLLSFDKVWKTYGSGEASVNALAGVSLSIDRGDFVAIMGPSGSGKSTAMNIIGCLDTPTAGRYSFEGIDAGRLDRNSRALLRNRYIGFVFQGYNLCRARGRRERRAAADLSRRAARRTPRPRQRSAGAGRPGPAASITRRQNCPAASSSAWRSPARS